MSITTALSVRQFNKSFNQIHVLKDIDFSIEKTDFLVLIGPSGCGKSTLLNCIAGFETFSSGSILINGKDMNNVPPGKREISMVFQSYALYPTMTVAKNITFGLSVNGVDKATQQAKLMQVAEKLELTALLDRKPAHLSGGQRQRVAMGRALVREPTLFLFDEPLSNLDAKLRVSMRTEIKKLHQTLKSTMIYVTHDQIEAMTLATKIIVLKDGVIQQMGTPDEIYTQPANQFVADFMGSPSMNLLEVTVSPHPKGMAITLLDAEQQSFTLIDSSPIANIRQNQPVILGIRPEHINIAKNDKHDEQNEHNLHTIDVVQPAGADTYLNTQLCNKEISIRVNASTHITTGTSVPLAFDLSQACYFDRDSGERIAK